MMREPKVGGGPALDYDAEARLPPAVGKNPRVQPVDVRSSAQIGAQPDPDADLDDTEQPDADRVTDGHDGGRSEAHRKRPSGSPSAAASVALRPGHDRKPLPRLQLGDVPPVPGSGGNSAPGAAVVPGASVPAGDRTGPALSLVAPSASGADVTAVSAEPTVASPLGHPPTASPISTAPTATAPIATTGATGLPTPSAAANNAHTAHPVAGLTASPMHHAPEHHAPAHHEPAHHEQPHHEQPHHEHDGHDAGNGAHTMAAPTGGRPAPQLANAKLTEAAKRIEHDATTQKAAIHASAQSEQRRVVAEAASKAAGMQQAAAAKISALMASISQKRAAISSTFSQARAAITRRTSADKAKAQSDGAKALADLKKLITDKKKSAKDGAETEAKGLEKTGHDQATRAHNETATTVSAIESAASSACSSAGGDADVQAAVQKAVGEAKTDAISKAQKQGGDVATKAEHDANDAAKKIRDGGDKLSDEVGSKTTDVEKSITDATNAAVQRIAAVEQTNLKQLTSLEQKSLAALDRVKGKVSTPLRAAASKAATQARRAGQQTATAIHHASDAQCKAIDHATHEGHTRLAALRGHEIDDAKLNHAVTAIGTSFAHVHKDGAAAISTEAGKVKQKLAQVQQHLATNLASAAAKVNSQIEQAVGSAHHGAAQATSKANEDSGQALTDMHQAHTKALTDFGTQLQKKIDDGNQKWKSQRTDHETTIKGDVDHGLKGVIDVRSDIGPKLNSIAAKAKEKEDRPWWKKALSGIWEGLKSFVGGLLVFIAAVLIVALIVLLFVSGIGEALLIAAEIVGAIMLVVGFVMALVSRWGQLMDRLKSGNYPWYAVIGLGALTILSAAGDVVGVTPLVEGIVGHDAVSWEPLSAEERWKRGTLGALTLITLGLARRAKIGGEEPIEPGERGTPHDDGHGPPSGHDDGHGPPSGHDDGHGPPSGHDDGHGPPSGHDDGHGPSSGHDDGHGPGKPGDDGHRPGGSSDNGRQPGGNDNGRQPGGNDNGRQPGGNDNGRQPGGNDNGRQPGGNDNGGRTPGQDSDPLEIRSPGRRGKVIGRFKRGSELEINSRDQLHGGNKIGLKPGETTTVTGTLDDVNVVARRGMNPDGTPNGVTKSGENPGGINILRSPKWAEIQARYQHLLDEGKELEYWQKVSDAFWEEANKPWMDEAMARGDAFRFVSDPNDELAVYVTRKGPDGSPEFVLDEHGQKIRSIFGRELDYLRQHGYVIMPDGTAVKPKP